MIKIEVIATTPQEAVDAKLYGASRIELISAPIEGGLTPSFGLVESVKSLIDIPVHVMIRPHAKSFVYDDEEKRLMLEDIRLFKQLNVDCFVIGALTKNCQIDLEFLNDVVAIAGDTDITFHRAIDEVDDIEEEVSKLANYPSIKRVLTSFGHDDIVNHLDDLKRLNSQMQKHHQTVLAGGGLNLENIELFLKHTNIKEVHFGRGVRVNNHYYGDLDQNKIKNILEVVDKLS